MIDILISIPFVALALYLVYLKFTSHPSDKYHNGTWRKDRRNRKR